MVSKAGRVAVWLRWHRRLGLVTAFLVMLLAVTGILINHSQDMGWHQQPVFSRVVAALYGIPPSVAENGYSLPTDPITWVGQVDSVVYFNRSRILNCSNSMLGAVLHEHSVAVLCGDSLWLFEPGGELIERLRGVPVNATQFGVAGSQLVLTAGTQLFQWHEASARWIPQALDSHLDQVKPAWAVLKPLPQLLAKHITEQSPIAGLTREQVLLDLHSGRLFGAVGVWLMDAAAVGMVLLACSGVVTWWRRRVRRIARNS